MFYKIIIFTALAIAIATIIAIFTILSLHLSDVTLTRPDYNQVVIIASGYSILITMLISSMYKHIKQG